MTLCKTIALLTSGGIIGMALVISCSDHSPERADAATCDCPAAEPPLAARLVRPSSTQTLAANQVLPAGVNCPQGSLLISGSCTTADINPTRSVTLEQAGVYDNENGWTCFFKNNEATPVTVKATAICLKSAP